MPHAETKIMPNCFIPQSISSLFKLLSLRERVAEGRVRAVAPRAMALLLLALLQPCSLWAAEAKPRPNVVVILTDDQGWGDLSVNGNTNLQTPSIDSLARDGAMFDRFYVCPVCSPTRAEFLTGRWHPRSGVWNVSTGGERLDLDETTIADTFKAAGYATAAFGKWHNGTQYPYHPRGRGFDEYYGFCSGHWGDYFNPPLEHNGQIVRGSGFITDDLTDHALKFIDEHRAEPFFLYLPYNAPHTPLQVPDRFYAKFKDADLKLRGQGKPAEDLATTRAVLAMCENIDWNVGRVLDKLGELQLANNTIVLYFQDNGPHGVRWNGGMRGRKGSTDEGGVRSPLLVRWPEHIRPGTKITQLAAAIDILPTLAELTGTKLVGKKPLDGMNLAPWLLGTASDTQDRQIFSHWGRRVSVRTAQYRLDGTGLLYDMIADPGQTRDISAEQPAVKAKLADAVAEWRRTVLVELTPDVDQPFSVGYREFPITHLPARDGVPHGNIRRSSKAPNCSYFTGWTSLDDRITWDVDVHTTGRYEAVVYYTCAPENVGAKIELALNDYKVQTTIDTAHNPPLVGAEHDRAPRGAESYVKDFKPQPLGTIELNRGRGLLALRALSMPGPGVIDVRGVTLTLLSP
jgi:arylsulfatase A-like enzyme